MTCPLCSCLVLDYSKVVNEEIPLPFEIDEVYPGLFQLTRNADGGCDFCRLLTELISEYFDAAEDGLLRPFNFTLSNAKFELVSATWVDDDDVEKGHWVLDTNPVEGLVMDIVYDQPPKIREMYFRVSQDTGGG